jgi:antitoxin component of MazEF toxin-antitoxin module
VTAALKSRKFGGSADVILPRDLLEGLNLGIGDELAVRVSVRGRFGAVAL